MTETTVQATSSAVTEKVVSSGTVVVPKAARGRPARPRRTASREAQCLAAAILEVLAGIRTPAEAAAAVGLSLPRYYLWEQRALEGLVLACEPRPVGKKVSQQHQIASLQKEVVRLQQRCSRQQALVRASQRTIGLTPVPHPTPKPGSKSVGKAGTGGTGRIRRKRRPTVRAMKAAMALRAAPVSEESPTDSSLAPATEVVQRCDVVTNPLPPAVAVLAAAAAPEG
jgi:hypothetical protein